MAQHYRALTRTYRPQTFDDIVSQEHVTSTLKNAIRQKRISHAYMFCGPRGVGKTTMARVLARAVNEIPENVDGEALNQTLNIVEMDAASNRKIEDVRQLKDVIRVPPQSGNYKIFIIDEVHMLTKEAFNALLKTLEEPPAHAIFIFATTEPHKVLPTILSRVQRFDFKRISVDEIVSRLKNISEKEDISIDEESLHIIAKKADGALRDALGLMDQAIAFCGTTIHYDELLKALNVIGHDSLFEFTQAVEKRDTAEGLRLIDQLMKEGADIQEYLVSLTEHIRNLYVASQGNQMHLVEATPDTKQRYKEGAKPFSEEDLMRMLHMVSEAQVKIKDVQQPRVHFEILMLKMIHMGRTPELRKILQGLDDIKKNGASHSHSVNGSILPQNREQEKATANDHGNAAQSEPNPEPARKQSPSSGDETAGESSYESIKPQVNGDAESEEEPPADTDSSEYVKSGLPSSPNPEESDSVSDNDFLMVKPSLGYAQGISSASVSEQGDATSVAEQTEDDKDLRHTISGIGDVEKHWKQFLNNIKENAPQMLYFQLLRVEIKELKGTDLIVSADNEFATRLLEENQQMLSSMFREVSGTFLRMKCIVERSEKKKSESLSPYERFKELQKKDPNLRTIVELFGAELEY
ncbi:DNA polymerase III subunit gamma/tau [Rhodohalobacter mucosus]|uniref:DNA polymerase III subunit gamma/tau n=1 Tax=Rhodohalobacter mucosus TaxID=2079485 RepID=A0A316U2X3_9BACT|nr:DNA polymerase III subunit gamma/tau [Rhodohalobacter mucosus]PWN07676.1 DNA polymerase III subunit gamma/tau [Rhodohalobacter mucosus]